MRRCVSCLTALCSAAVIAGGCGSDSAPKKSDLPAEKPGTISTAGCKPDQTAERYPSLAGRTLKIATSPLSPPFIFTDAKDRKKIVGFDADFVRAWTSCLGLKYDWQAYQEVPAMIAAVQSGRADLVHAELYVNPDRAKQVDFVVYMKSLTGAVVAKGNPKQITSLDALCGHSDAQAVGVLEVPLVKGQSEKCRKRGKPPVRLVTYRDNNQAVQAVVRGRADAFLGDTVYVDSIEKRFPDRVETAFTIDNHLDIGVGVNKEQPELRQAIVAAIKAIQANGTEDRLLRKWDLDVKQSVPARSDR